MEEAATNEIQEVDLPSGVKLPQSSTEDKNINKEEENSDDKGDQAVTSPVAKAEGNEPQESVQNSVDNVESVNQLGNPSMNITVASDETNKGAIDQEKEKSQSINIDNQDISLTTAGVTLNDSNVPQMENTVETGTNVDLVEKDHDGKVDTGKQLDKKDDVETVVPSEEVEGVAPTEASAQVVDKESSEKDDSKTEVSSEKAEGVSTSESPHSAQVIDKETPEGDSGVPSQGMTEDASTESKTSGIDDKGSPEGDVGRTEIPSDSKEITNPETQPLAQLIDKETTKEEGNETRTTPEVQPPVDQPEMQNKEEESPVSAEASEVTKTKPETTADEAGGEEKQPGEVSSTRTTWYTDEEENQQQGTEGYSTTVVGGVVMRKSLPSTSSDPKKPARGPSTGSVFKRMSFGSIFGKRRSTKKKPDMAQQAVTETPVHDGTDGAQETKPNDSDKEESSTPVETTAEEVTQAAGGPSEATTAEKPPDNGPEVPEKKVEEEKDIAEGAIVPLEEGVVEDDEKTTKMVDEASEQDERKDDVESPLDEDSLLRERIAKRESTSSSHSPSKHMQMRMSYAEGTKEVEVIGTREAPSQNKQDKKNTSKDNNRLSCRELGEVDHEGWLTKRGGGAIFASWKRKWVVLKEQHVYYYKTSFDPEAGGVIGVKDHTITAAPEMKKRFCFKIESEDPKAAKMYFAADSQEDMDKWISVLGASSRGEVIVRKTQNQQSGDTTMRKKTNSMGKRAGSVLGIGGYYSYDGELEKTDQRRRASFGSSPKEATKNIKPVENKDRSESPTDNATPSDIQRLLTPKAEGDSVDGPIALETSSTAPLQEESSSPEVTPIVASAVDNQEQKPLNMEAEVKISSSETPKEECPPEIKPLEKTMATPETSQSEIKETKTMSTPYVSQSETKETKTMATPNDSQSETKETKTMATPNVSQSETTETTETKTMATPNVSQSEIKESSEEQKDTCVATPSQQPPKPSKPTESSNTTWYYVLDADDGDWNDVDVLKAKDSKRESDELLSLVRTIKDARVSIIGTPLPGNEERARAMTHVSKQNEEVLKLREMKRALKDKQRDLMAMEELLTKDVNRQSIHEWKTRYSYLAPEDTTGENESMDKENDSKDEKNEINGLGIQGGEVDVGVVSDGKIEENKVDDGADVHEVKSDESVEDNTGLPEHDGDVRNGGEDQSAKPEDGDNVHEVKSEENVEEKIFIPEDDGDVRNGGEDQSAKLEDDEDVQKGGKPEDDKEDDGGETQDEKLEEVEDVQEDRNGKGSPKDNKLEVNGDAQMNANNDANDIRLAEEIVHEKKKRDSDDEAGESAKQATQEERTETNNNSGTKQDKITGQSEPEKNDEENGDEKSIDTSETLPVQDQDSIDTRF